MGVQGMRSALGEGGRTIMTTLSHDPIATFVTLLRDRFDITTLVETGTFEGESALWAAEHFANVVTIDIRDDDRGTAYQRCRDHRNIEFIHGDTRDALPEVIATLDRPALIWLDAHAAPGLFGDADDWPILDELEIINTSPHKHFILIDDAHCFLPGTPHPACPTFDQVAVLAIAYGYQCRFIDDVICVVPADVAGELDLRAGW
jgi:hypothetical protein